MKQPLSLPTTNLRQAAGLAAFAALCVVVGAALGTNLGPLLGAGAAAGLLLGSVPAWLPRIAGALPFARGFAQAVTAARCAELLCLGLLVVVAIVVSMQGLLPVLDDEPVRIEATVQLLLAAPALYVAYLIAGRGVARRQASVQERLASALSGPPMVLTLAFALAIATAAVLLIHYFGLSRPGWEHLASKFVDRGIIPPLTLVLFFWGLLLLANKTWVLWRERRLLDGDGRGASVLAGAHAQAVGEQGDDGAVADFLDMMWKKSADFYVVPRYINWAIPILGFIGTVLGISLAADGIRNIVGSRGTLSDLSGELGQAIAPLGIAFDTTLIALSLSVFLTLLQIALQRWEDNLLVDYESWVRSQVRGA